ncbi:glycosyltransferase family 4 protein [Halobacteria archaeon AArc-dxtr1]|nr:glycosyltransferase family 4 protein [Halobacteria archaeon AArc-dxtr1]
MRLAFVSFETVFHRGREANQRFQTVLELLRDGGHDVHVFCARFWSEEPEKVERDGITYHAISSGLEARTRFLLRLPFALAKAKPDVIHANADRARDVLAAKWGSRLSRAPLVVEWYDATGRRDERRRQKVATCADRIVVPSELVGTRTRELGADGSHVEIVPNPIEVDRIQDVEPDDRIDVVYARRLDEGANLESLLLGLAELRGRQWRTVIIGDGPERATYERLASDLRIDDRVEFVGECSREERLSLYRGAHVFAQTAADCAFPTEMLWALAAGCVGIVEYHVDSSAHELVEGWGRGFRTTSEQELANAILAAGELEHRESDDRFDAYDEDAVRERYLRVYQAVSDS